MWTFIKNLLNGTLFFRLNHNQHRHEVINRFQDEMIKIEAKAKRQNIQSERSRDTAYHLAKSMGIIK